MAPVTYTEFKIITLEVYDLVEKVRNNLVEQSDKTDKCICSTFLISF